MSLSYFDLVVGSVVLLLGLKGIINGLFKELFGLIGIIGGVFVASRLSESVGTMLSETIFHFSNSAAINFTGLLVVLSLFWIAMIAVGHLLKKLSAMSGLGMVDRIFGFIFGAGKFFLIASVIAYAVYNVKTVRANIEKPLQNSILFPAMVEIGSYIMKIDTDDLTKKVEQKQQEIQEGIAKEIENRVSDEVEETGKQIQKEVQNKIEEKIEKATDGE